MKATPVIFLAIAVLLVVGGVVWFLQQPPPQLGTAMAPMPVATHVEMAPPVSVPTGGTPIPKGNTGEAKGRAASAPASAAPPPMAEWENRIDQVLRTNGTETETAQLMINLLPTLPPEGQAEAAQHISNLILDKDYGRVMPLVRNASLPEEVHDVLYTDLMNREDPVKLPTLLEVAKIPNHPFHEQALADLQVFLDQDNESNWGKWDTAIKGYLQKEKAEDSAADALLPPEPAAPAEQ